MQLLLKGNSISKWDAAYLFSLSQSLSVVSVFLCLYVVYTFGKINFEAAAADAVSVGRL